jgi:hypothetical protein
LVSTIVPALVRLPPGESVAGRLETPPTTFTVLPAATSEVRKLRPRMTFTVAVPVPSRSSPSTSVAARTVALTSPAWWW